MFWIALAASITAPEPRDMWLNNEDTPTKELGDRAAVETRLRLTIAPDGRVHGCAIEQTSGNVNIDQYTCDLARRRALFRPAQSADGAPMFGIYRVPVIWAAVPVTPKPNGDVVYKLGDRPKGLRLPATVHVVFAVDKSGHVSDCLDEPPTLVSQIKNNPELVPLACEQILKNYAAIPARDDAGQPVPSVQNLTALFLKP